MEINVVYAIPPNSFKFNEWHDGFTAAMERVASQHHVRWFNVHPEAPTRRRVLSEIFRANVVLVKSDWGWVPDLAVRARQIFHPTVPVILAISGSTPPPKCGKWAYDGLLYETEWYARFVGDHPIAKQAFGIDTRVMRSSGDETRDIDWLMVGRPMPSKRPERLLSKRGYRVFVGDNASSENEQMSRLLADGVEVRDFVGYGELADFYRRSKNVLVPCKLQGGGERSVLEARACGASVEVAEDNPKLDTLLTGPILTHETYADSILECLREVEQRTEHVTIKKLGSILFGAIRLWIGFSRRAVSDLVSSSFRSAKGGSIS